MPGEMFETGRPISCFHPFFQNRGMYHENKSEIRYAVRSGVSHAGFHDFSTWGGVLGADCLCTHDDTMWRQGWTEVDGSTTSVASAVGGYSNQASKEYSSALGVQNTVRNYSSQAIGYKNTVYGYISAGIGINNKVTGKESAAFGMGNVIGDNTAETDTSDKKGYRTFVFGARVNTAANNAIVLGSDTSTVANNSVVIGNGSTSTEENVVSVGAEGNERKIVNVKAGEKDTDAVNKGQMDKAIDEALADIGVGTGVTERLNRMDDDIHKVGAGAAALAALHPENYDPNDKWSFAVGYGHYRNANAGALGAFFKPNADTTVSIGSTIGNGNPMLNAGVSFKLGHRGAKLSQNASNSQLVQEVNALRADNNRLRDDNRVQAEKIERLEAQVRDDSRVQAEKIERLEAQVAALLAKEEVSW